LQEAYLSKRDTVQTGNRCARWYCFSHGWFSLKTYMCFFSLAE
jgi:hypothetical protein